MTNEKPTKPIINSLCDLDYYKLTMMNFVYYYESNAQVKYKFTCRKKVDFTDSFEEIKEQVRMLGDLRFTELELEYLSKIPYFRESFIRYLRGFSLNPNDVTIEKNGVDLDITIEGPWVNTILFETLIMAIISEVYFKRKFRGESYKDVRREGRKRLDEKIQFLMELKGKNLISFAEFGTRRRFSQVWQEEVVMALKKSGYSGFVGTSNVYLAMKHRLKPIGTMAHELLCAHAGFTRPDKSVKLALKRWLEFYEGNLGTALTDTYTTDHFLKDFNGTLARGFTGVRQDSGDPIEWGYKMINHYNELGINLKLKNIMLLFSDGLDFKSALKIHKEFNPLAKVSFGIGTDLTNDMGEDALNIVIKMVECEGFPLIKISDSPGKTMCEDEEYKSFALKLFGVK